MSPHPGRARPFASNDRHPRRVIPRPGRARPFAPAAHLPLALASSLFAASAARAGPPGAPDPRDAAVVAACGRGDVALGTVAASLAVARLAGGPLPEGAALARALRDAGSDAPWPRWLALAGTPVDRAAAAARARSWASTLPGPATRRCGAGSARDDLGHEALVVVAAPDAARLSLIPPAPRVGQWVEARTIPLVAATSPHLVVLGPRGTPFSPPAWLREGTLVSRFLVDRGGVWVVQALADLGTGPVPTAEVRLVVGVSDGHEPAAPGEDEGGPDDATLAFAMANAARAAEGRAPLVQAPALDRVAAAHAARLAAGTTPTHDTGAGDAAERVAAAGFAASEIGEVVAHAPSIALAHRALWASPSHRATMLARAMRAAGFAVHAARGGGIWLVEVFVAP